MRGVGFTMNTKEHGEIYCVVNTGRVMPAGVEMLDGRSYVATPPHVEDIEVVSIEVVCEVDPRHKMLPITGDLARQVEEYANEYIITGERL